MLIISYKKERTSMNDVMRQDRLSKIVIWSLIGLAILLVIFIVFRILTRYMEYKKLNVLIEKEPAIKSGVELLKAAWLGNSIPPLMCFKIKMENIYKLGIDIDNTVILENKRTLNLGYKYYIINSPCVFQFNSPEKISFKKKLEVSISSEIRISNIVERFI